jgi:hypothetical protein
MVAGVYRLGVDLGTSNTVAMLARPDGRIEPLLFNGAPTLPSCVCVTDSGDLAVGPDAVHSAAGRPECFEPYPKQRIDDGTVLLGDTQVPVADLLAAVLRRVADEAVRVAGGPVGSVTLTHPATWGTRRRETLLVAASAAGLGRPVLVPEPVAAAAYFVTVLGGQLAPGAALAIFDLGAGTFDASVVRRDAFGFTPLAVEGRDPLGGLDLDAAVLTYVAEICASRVPDEWQRLVTATEERARYRALWDDVRAAKEMLSRSAATVVHVPVGGPDVPLGRDLFDQLAEPVVAQAVAATDKAIRAAGIAAADLAGVLLVGGSSRVPLAGTLLHRGLGVPPTVLDQPELVVAAGALHASVIPAVPVPMPPVPGRAPAAVAPPVVPAGRAPAAIAPPVLPAGPPPRRRRWTGLVGLAAALLWPAALLVDGTGALVDGVRAPFGLTAWLGVLGALAVLVATGTAPAPGHRSPPGWLAALGTVAAVGYAAAVAASAAVAGVAGTADDRLVAVIAVGVLAVVLGIWLLVSANARSSPGALDPLARPATGGSRALRLFAAGFTGLALGVAARAEFVPTDRRPAALAALFAAGVSAAAIAVVLSAAFGRRLLNRLPRAPRTFASGTAYGLCAAAGVALAYQAWTELRSGPDTLSVLTRLGPAGGASLGVLVTAGALGWLVFGRRSDS